MHMLRASALLAATALMFLAVSGLIVLGLMLGISLSIAGAAFCFAQGEGCHAA